MTMIRRLPGRDRLRHVLSILGVISICTGSVLTFSVASSSAAPGDSEAATFVDYAQCANDKPPSTSTACPSGWINGILNTNNSHFREDQVTPQRAEVVVPEGSDPDNRTLTFRYQTRKDSSGAHAYDSLATWNHTQTTAYRCEGLLPADCVGGPLSWLAIPADPTVVADANGAGTATSGHQLPNQRMEMYGGVIDSISVPVHDNPTGPGDDYASVTVTYHVADTSVDRKVQLLFGGHLAPSFGPRGWGAGVGAGSVSGGPYHIKWELADGESIGNRDNQIMADAILPQAEVSVSKTTATSLTRSYTWDVEKSVDGDAIVTTDEDTVEFDYDIVVTKSAPVDSNWKVTGVITVTNSGDAAANGINVTEGLTGCTIHPVGQTTGTYTQGSANVAAGGSVNFNYTCPRTTATAGDNSASVTWTGHSEAVSTGNVPFSFDSATVTTQNDCTEVTDTFDGGTAEVLAASQCSTRTFETSHTVDVPEAGCSGEVTNTAAVTGDTDDADVQACRTPADLLVTKTVAERYTKTWTWGIEKSVVGASTVTRAGGDVTFDYLIDVTRSETAATTGFVLSGSILVANGGGTTAENLDVSDDPGIEGADCTIFAPESETEYDGTYDLAPDDDVTFAYVCDVDADADTTGDNVATVDYDGAEAAIDSTEVGYDFGDADVTEVDECVAVDDLFDGGTAVELNGNLCESAVLETQHTVTVGTACETYRNTASSTTNDTETTDESSVDVTVCPETATPATPGYTEDTSCEDPDSYTIPDIAGVVYRVGGVLTAPGTYTLAEGVTVTITAEPESGYVLSQAPTEAGWTWSFTGSDVQRCRSGGGGTTTTTVAPTTTTTAPELPFTPEPEVIPVVITAPQPAPVLPFTGSDSNRMLLVGASLLTAGTLMVLLGRRRRA